MTLLVEQLRASMSEAEQQRQAILDELERLDLVLTSMLDVSRKHAGELQYLERRCAAARRRQRSKGDAGGRSRRGSSDRHRGDR